jgi:hypothetical protein
MLEDDLIARLWHDPPAAVRIGRFRHVRTEQVVATPRVRALRLC